MPENDTDTDDPTAQIETIVVDPDDVIEALRFNGQPPEYRNQRDAVIRVSPPFGAESEANIHYSEEGTYYPPEMDPKPLHLAPRQFVGEAAIDRPVRGDERARAKRDLDDPTEEEIESYVTEAFDVWEEDVRATLVDEININQYRPGRGETVEVRYR